MIRDYSSEDYEQLKAIYESQGFDYSFPQDLDNPLFLVKKVREVNGQVVGAMFLRITAEAFLLVQGSPVTKGRSIEELQPEVDREAFEKGLADYVCVLPPEIAKSFIPVMERLGWAKTRPWTMMQRDLDAICCRASQ